MNRLLDTLNKTNAQIIVTDLIPVVENRYTEQATLIRRNEDVEKYNQIIENICLKRNITFFARYNKWKNRNLETLYKDATHPNAEGHEIIADELFDFYKNRNLSVIIQSPIAISGRIIHPIFTNFHKQKQVNTAIKHIL